MTVTPTSIPSQSRRHRARRSQASRRAALAILAALFALWAGPASLGQTFTDPGFSTEVVATFAPFEPVGMAWAPDGRIFVWQKNGIVRVIENGTLLPTPFLDFSSQVNVHTDRGMSGLAFHPDFPTVDWIYLAYVYEEGTDTLSTAPKVSRVSRVRPDPGNPNVMLAGSEEVIVGTVSTPPCSAWGPLADCIPADNDGHAIGGLRFGADDMLYIANGDGASAAFVDNDAFRAQDLDSLAGKILRVNPDGTGPPDNPFYVGPTDNRSKVWAYGFRNPYRFDFEPGDGHVWAGDVGWLEVEEIDHVHMGENYGWPCYEGTNPHPSYQTREQCNGLTSNLVEAPVYDYNHVQFGESCAIGGPFYSATAYPEAYRDSYFFADYSGNLIRRLVFDGNGLLVDDPDFATGIDAPVALEQGPDGLLYYVSYTTGEIRRIRYAGPVAEASATPASGYSPLQVNFSSAGSYDTGGGALTYSWDFGDGNFSSDPNPVHTYTDAGVTTRTATLTVTNPGSQTSTASVDVTVGSLPPTATVTSPSEGTGYLPGQIVTFTGTGADPDDGSLPPASLEWTVLLRHNTHVHFASSTTGPSGQFEVTFHGEGDTYSYELQLEVVDSSGLRDKMTVSLPVLPDSQPPGVPGGVSVTPVSSGEMDVQWTATTDNGGVKLYRVERCALAGCSNFVEVGTTSGTSFSDSVLAANTTYRYRVRAEDASLNLGGFSATAEGTTLAGPSATGLVVALGFEEGAGGTAFDESGNGNDATLNGPAWTTAGKSGGALQFDGVDDLAVIANSPTISLGAEMTLEAWVNPAEPQTGWRTIMQREVDAYFLHAGSSGTHLHPTAGGTIGDQISYVKAPSALSVLTWAHVAATYDGATLRIYVDGQEVVSKPDTGTIQGNSNPVRIGGNVPYGEYFSGIIDELRIYNRALSPSEIQADMVTIVTPPALSPAPGEASKPTDVAQQMKAVGYDPGTGEVSVTYMPACSATDHNIYWGDLASVSTYSYSGVSCAVGSSGSAAFTPGAGSHFFLIVGNDGAVEGSYGNDWFGSTRPEELAAAGCELPQDLGATCD